MVWNKVNKSINFPARTSKTRFRSVSFEVRLLKYKVSPYGLMARGLSGERIEKIVLHDIFNEIFL